jgi:hypothetical protein
LGKNQVAARQLQRVLGVAEGGHQPSALQLSAANRSICGSNSFKLRQAAGMAVLVEYCWSLFGLNSRTQQQEDR